METGTLDTESQAQEPAPAPPAAKKYSLAAQVIVLLCGTLSASLLTFVATRTYSQRYSVNEVSAVLVFRLMGIFLMGISGIGMPVSMLRNISLQRHSPERAKTAISVGLTLGCLSLLIGCGTAFLFSFMAFRVAAIPSAQALWSAYSVYTFFQGLVGLVGVVWLSMGHPVRSVLLSFSAFGLAQVVPLFLFPKAPITFVLWGSAAFAGICVIPFFVKVLWENWKTDRRLWRLEARILLQFATSRLPGILVEPLGDLTIPWLALASGAGLKAAGYLAVGMALMRPMNPLTSALNNVMVPATARLVASEDESAQKRQADLLGEWSLQLGLFGSMMLAVWCDVIIQVWLGPGFREAVPAVRVIALAILPVFAFASMRGIVEALTHRPLNTWSLLATYTALLAGSFAFRFLGFGPFSLPSAYLFSRILLASLTILFLVRMVGFSVSRMKMAFAIAAIAGLLGLNLGFRAWMGPSMSAWHLVTAVVASAGIFLAAMSAAGADWARYFTARIRRIVFRGQAGAGPA